jgi:hypothetical protein
MAGRRDRHGLVFGCIVNVVYAPLVLGLGFWDGVYLAALYLVVRT